MPVINPADSLTWPVDGRDYSKPATPPHWTWELTPIRTHFTRRGYRVDLFVTFRGKREIANPWGFAEMFCGNDGRTVRADAIRHAKDICARKNSYERRT